MSESLTCTNEEPSAPITSATSATTLADTILVHKSLFLQDSAESSKVSTALVILNSPVRHPPSPLFTKLWDTAHFRVCADGGANRLYRATTNNTTDTTAGTTTTTTTTLENSLPWIPDLIIGDLDSLQTSVRDYYERQGSRVVQDADQDCNDLDKALRACVAQGCRRVYCFGAFGGRFDQEMACIQALYKWNTGWFEHFQLYDDATTAFLLAPNVTHHIQLARHDTTVRSRVGEGPTCGLIPVAAPVDRLTISGFQWDLHEHPTSFGGLVSTSNRVMAETVTVTASHPIVFTAQVHSGVVDDDDNDDVDEQ